jgi:hypothetical protein
MSDAIAERYRKDRTATAAMLGFDLDKLSAAQSVRLDRAISLRLVIDDMQLKQLHGEAIDVKEFVAASESLERLCGGEPEQTTGPHHDAALQVEGMINSLIATKQRADHQRDADRMWCDELQAVVAAGGDADSCSKPAGGLDAQRDSVVSHPALIEQDAPASGPSVAPVTPQPQRVESAEEKMARVNSTPAIAPRSAAWRSLKSRRTCMPATVCCCSGRTSR